MAFQTECVLFTRSHIFFNYFKRTSILKVAMGSEYMPWSPSDLFFMLLFFSFFLSANGRTRAYSLYTERDN